MIVGREIYAHVYTHVNTYVHTEAHAHAHTHTRTYACTHTLCMPLGKRSVSAADRAATCAASLAVTVHELEANSISKTKQGL